MTATMQKTCGCKDRCALEQGEAFPGKCEVNAENGKGYACVPTLLYSDRDRIAAYQTQCGEQAAEIEHLKAELARLTPSGQVAEDAVSIRGSLECLFANNDDFAAKYEKGDFAALSRLTAQAQGYEAFAEENTLLRGRLVQMDGQRLQAEQAHDAAVADSAALRKSATKASAELRHTYHPETRDWNLVARAISILEKATTPDHAGAAILKEMKEQAETIKALVEALEAVRGCVPLGELSDVAREKRREALRKAEVLP